jgi:hypothetical protein
MGSALAAADEDVTSAKNWLAGQQRTDGGFPAELNGSSSDVMATSEAMFLATGKNLLDASLKLSKCPKNPKKLPASTTSCTGVWVVVDRGNGQETVRCATKYSNGIAALKSAGLTVGTDKSGFLNRINGFPQAIEAWTPTTKVWVYWHAAVTSDGTWAPWELYNVGPGTSKPVKGEAEGWSLMIWPEGSTTTTFPSPPKGYEASPDPLITGTAQVNQTLTANPGAWTPSPDKVSIRWYRSGKAISGATKATYKVTKADYKKAITVKVTASGSGYQTVTRTSLPTATVTK